jgi:hypothetical protein
LDFFDIVNFDFRDFPKFGFSKVFVVGKDIFLCRERKKAPSIFFSSDEREMINNIKFFDFFYLQSYNTNLELATKLKQKGKFFLVSIGDILSSKGIEKANKIAKISRFVKFCNFYDVDFVLATLAKDFYEIRTPREIERIGELIGLTREQARFSISLEKVGDVFEKYLKG